MCRHVAGSSGQNTIRTLYSRSSHKTAVIRMMLYYQGKDVMNIAVLLIALFSSEKVYFILMTENPLEQMSQCESHIGF